MKPDTLFAGIDLGSEKHWIVVLSSDGATLMNEEVTHSPDKLNSLVEKLMALCGDNPARLRVALEVPRGPVVELLMERRFQVFFINPKQLDRFRDRRSVAGKKDDRFDAFVLAHSLITDGVCFHSVMADDPKVIELRELMRCRDNTVEDCRRVTNRIRDQMYRYHVALFNLCPAADEPWVWALWALFKRPSEKLPTVGKVRALLKAHRIRRVTPEDVHARLKSGRLTVLAGVEDSAVSHIEMLIPQARLLHDQIIVLEKRIAGVLDDIENSRPSGGPGEPPTSTSTLNSDVKNLRTFNGIGDIVLTKLLCCAGQQVRDRNYKALRAHGGLAPVTKRSGNSLLTSMRYACSTDLRNAFHAMAQSNINSDPRSRELYAAHRARGHSHGRALRAVADRCLRIIMAMLRDQLPYEPRRLDAAMPA